MGKKKRASRVPSTRKPINPRMRATAVHEAGHVVVAHALGRDVQRVRIGKGTRRLVTAITRLLIQFDQRPSTRPDRYSRMSSKIASRPGMRSRRDQLRWLRSQALIACAGPIAEAQLMGRSGTQESAAADFNQLGRIPCGDWFRWQGRRTS
jgi:hypothetical protein